jgi:tetratricopeptide (TPR) repeat protein
MFFTRLRGHAKWMFVFLALVFGVGFVGFGIGANQNASIGDLLRGGGGQGSGSVSVSDARDRVKKNPKNADAQRELATALQQDGQSVEAITVLTRYIEQRPKDQDALRELAGLHLSRAITFSQRAQEAQVRASYLSFGSAIGGSLQLGKGGQALGSADPIGQAVATQASQAVNEAYTDAQASFRAAEQTYDKLVATAPKDPNVRLELAQAAQQSGNYAKAIDAYQTFLKLAPDDPSAPIVKQQIAQLKQAQQSASTG